MAADVVLRADAVGYARGAVTILDDVTVAVRTFEVLAITGASGSGKSSLLALLAGLEQPDRGQVLLHGATVGEVPEGVGIVLQSYGLLDLLTAAENVEVALQARGVPRDQVLARASAALARVGLDHVADHLVEELSGGQQQRVAIARALVIEPGVLIADEVTAELDADTKQLVVELLFEHAARGTAVVIATHDVALASQCARRLRLVDGRIQA